MAAASRWSDAPQSVAVALPPLINNVISPTESFLGLTYSDEFILLEVTFLISRRERILAEAWRSAHSSPPAGNR